MGHVTLRGLPPIGGWLSDIGKSIQKGVLDPVGKAVQDGLDSAGNIIQKNVIDPVVDVANDVGSLVQDGLDSVGDQLHKIEAANRAGLQRLAPCAVAVGITYVTGGATSAPAAALCLPALLPGDPPEMVPLSDPRAQEYVATHPTTFEPGDPSLFGIPGLPAPSSSNMILYGALAVLGFLALR